MLAAPSILAAMVICAGELLVDLVTADYADTLAEASAFEAHPGGSPANLAVNLRALGAEAEVLACVGDDGFGAQLREHLRMRGLGERLLRVDPAARTTLIPVTKSRGTPDFLVYRGADERLAWSQFAAALALPGARILHTTCFALSGLPARSHLLRAAAAFAKTGATLSLDANYAPGVWPDRPRAQAVVRQWCGYGALVKVSEDDWQRLYEEPLALDTAAARGARLLDAGARAVCMTFGGEGAALLTSEGLVRLAAKPVQVVDATGAGDSFWAGFLAAYLEGATWAHCLRDGIRAAAIKLQRQGPLPEGVREGEAWGDLE